MICVTGREATSTALERRLESVTRLPNSTFPPLHEVRLDALGRLDDDVWSLLRRHAPRLIVCCRPPRQGGWFEGSEAERLGALRAAGRTGVAWLDLEADLSDEDLASMGTPPGGRRIVSWHDLDGVPADLHARAEAMARRGADVVKLAVRPRDAVDLQPLLELGRRFEGRAVLLGMGPAGLLSRCRYADFGSAWTYVASEAAGATAPSQLTLAQALELGLPGSAGRPFLALIGGPQVMDSPGPRVYNRLFRKRDLPWSYIPVLTQDADAVLDLLRRMGALGVSVTMPHKRAILDSARADPMAAAAGAANSVRFDPGGAVCTNTDITGIFDPLRDAIAAGAQRGRALILGAGGAARAAVLACRGLGLGVALSARDAGKAEQALGAQVSLVPWPRRAEEPFDVLINATPLAGRASPWPSSQPLRKSIVFDLAIAAEPSALLQQARDEGAIAIGPEEMWVAQGAPQLSWITGETFSAQELRELLP
jgi:3-dehydroquinate dehydratase / shikimate dehydrogenase